MLAVLGNRHNAFGLHAPTSVVLVGDAAHAYLEMNFPKDPASRVNANAGVLESATNTAS
jgi:hypothetical protein